MHVIYTTETHTDYTSLLMDKHDKRIKYYYNKNSPSTVDILEGDKIGFTVDEFIIAQIMFRKWILLVKNQYNGNPIINGTQKISKEITNSGKHILEISRTGSTVLLTYDPSINEVELKYTPPTGTAQLGSMFRGLFEAIKWLNSGFAVSNVNITDVVVSIVKEEF